MPYITKESREYIDNGLSEPVSPGELNYALTKLLNENYSREAFALRFKEIAAAYVEVREEKYQTFNDIVGAGVSAVLEHLRRKNGLYFPQGQWLFDELQQFYLRVVGPYEDRKIKENGDIAAYVPQGLGGYAP